MLDKYLERFYMGDINSFSPIWELVEKEIKWCNYYDPTGVYTIDDFKQECALFLFKRMDKWNKNIPFMTFAVVKCYSRLNWLVGDLINKTNIYRRGKNRKRAKKYENRFLYIDLDEEDDDELVFDKPFAVKDENIDYDLYVDSLLNSFDGEKLTILLEMLKCERNTIQAEIRRIEEEFNISKKRIKLILKEIRPLIEEMLCWRKQIH